jgi:hypothetical protein
MPLGGIVAGFLIAGLAFAMATRLRPPPARMPAVVRAVGAVACTLAGSALLLVILMGWRLSGESRISSQPPAVRRLRLPVR